jgi:DNA-binding NtrC family response regulator
LSRILLIEDDTGTQLLSRNRLMDLGYEVVVASTGALGLMEARSSSFDLFLVDITLGSGIDGFEVCRRLKSVPEIHRVPVVLISANVKSREELHRGYEAGCQAFLVKGDLVLLEDVVRAHLHAKAVMDELAVQNRLLEEQNRRLEAGLPPEGTSLPATASGGPARDAVRPDGILLVDAEGAVRAGDRGARELFGASSEGRHLAHLAPDSRLEARVRNARQTEAAVRFDLPARAGRKARPLVAGIHPLVPAADRSLPDMSVLFFFEAARLAPAATGPGAGPTDAPEYRALLLEAARAAYRPESVLGASAAVRALRARLAELVGTDGTVLVQGPAGVGKEFLARILHFTGVRSGPFVSVACGAGAGTIEFELFGPPARPESAFPGALVLARGGTLFLRDVERLPPPLQERLRVHLAAGGSPQPRTAVTEPSAPRVVAATSVELLRHVELGRFHPGLAEALTQTTLVLPPLSERRDDVRVLARAFLARRAGPDARFEPDVEEALARHDWPGNARELDEVVGQAWASAEGGVVGLRDLPPSVAERVRAAAGAVPSLVREESERARFEREYQELPRAEGARLLDDYERCALLHALYLTGGDKLAAARLLELGKSTLYRKLKQYAIT